MPFEKVNLNTPHLTLWLSSEQGLVFHQGQKSLSQLEPITIAILIALDEGLTDEQAIVELQQYSKLTTQQITPALAQVKALFDNSQEPRTYADGRYPELKPHHSQSVKKQDFCIQVANSTFVIQCANKTLEQDIQALLQPIQIKTEQLANQQRIDFIFEVKIEQGQYQLYSNNLLVEQDLKQNQVVPILIDRLQILSYQQSNYCFGFHGAALKNEHNTILLPGVSGAGKSTLTAELSKQNFQVYSDEIIALDNNFTLTSLALPMAIKSGSWQHIAELYPEIEKQKQWHRIDGRILKYIWPEHIAQNEVFGDDLGLACAIENGACHTNTTTQTLLLSPKYDKRATPKATKLTVSDTLKLVTEGGYQLGVELNEHTIEKLLDYCQHISTYQITYATSEQADNLVTALCQA
ncbi:hypothetical protein [Thalassotalea sp. ND16A]|uniref:hypothetical protein n=1 Tax=Thalassotalea sp. ND16A TaxID=1535422 RepID=UPI00051A41BE|nr:hypothetical protein [Thalassotalea sp. ND16A]KGJ94214.1 hypothetical protein ND16A_1420 [Thalassotalea sp. ND16A]